jgi:hypothetical protein
MRRGLGRGRRGGGLLGTAARTAVIAGTATAVSGRVAAGRQAAAESAPAAATAPISVDELHAQLTKLADLRQAGLLSEEEFATQKARLLAP